MIGFDPEVDDKLWFNDLIKLIKLGEKKMADYTYAGKQKTLDKELDMHLYNCNKCGTTLAVTRDSDPNKLEEHLKRHHYPRWYEIQKYKQKMVAENYMNYLMKGRNK